MMHTKNQNLSVKTRDGKLWGGDEKGYPRIYAVGDCNYSCVDAPGKKPDEWPIPPIPKISYPGEEMCIVACSNIEKTDRLLFQNKTVDCCGEPLHVWDMHWPWGAGMFATSLGPDDACFVAGANWQKNSGLMCVWGQVCAVQKEFIEASKTDECAYGPLDFTMLISNLHQESCLPNLIKILTTKRHLKSGNHPHGLKPLQGFIGRCIWYFVHHTPVHLFGGGPRWGYWVAKMFYGRWSSRSPDESYKTTSNWIKLYGWWWLLSIYFRYCQILLLLESQASSFASRYWHVQVVGNCCEDELSPAWSELFRFTAPASRWKFCWDSNEAIGFFNKKRWVGRRFLKPNRTQPGSYWAFNWFKIEDEFEWKWMKMTLVMEFD